MKMEKQRAFEGRNARLDASKMIAIFENMLRIRLFDQRVADLFEQGHVKGTAHSYVGQEAVAASVCATLNPDDFIGSYHRGHGHCIAKGADVKLMMAELFGKIDGYCGGLGGSMHIADLNLGILGANGIVGATMPLCAGAALTSQISGSQQVSIAFFGDGASNQGVFHEALNIASVWKLPVVFVCENNQYALTTSFKSTTSIERIADRASAYGIPGMRVDGNVVEDVYFAAAEAVERARTGGGPTLIEAMTYRWGQHSMRANLRDPRPDQEVADWVARDPIVLLEEQLRERTILADDQIDSIKAKISKEIDLAVDFGHRSLEPGVERMLSAVYAPHELLEEPNLDSSRELSFTEAISEALHQEMARDEKVVILGEDIAATGGIFQATAGLLERFGPERVRDTPISEATFVGCAVGAALTGLRPVVELQIFDFVALTMDMLVNQAAKLRFMLGGKAQVPLVIRGPQGGGIRMAAQHSQSLEAWFTHIPGLVTVAPSSPYDAKGLLTSAIRDNNPVIFLETKLLYVGNKGVVPEEQYAIPLGKGVIKRKGSDVTVVATMAMVERALAAAKQLEREAISVEVIDPRTLRPLDEELILDSVRKTNRLVICHEACMFGGFGAEVAALVNEKAFDYLDAPIVRVGAPAVPMPYNDKLEREVIPSQQRIATAIRGLLQNQI